MDPLCRQWSKYCSTLSTQPVTSDVQDENASINGDGSADQSIERRPRLGVALTICFPEERGHSAMGKVDAQE